MAATARLRVKCELVSAPKDPDPAAAPVQLAVLSIFSPSVAPENALLWPGEGRERLSLRIANPDGFGLFQAGREYFLDISEAWAGSEG